MKRERWISGGGFVGWTVGMYAQVDADRWACVAHGTKVRDARDQALLDLMSAFHGKRFLLISAERFAAPGERTSAERFAAPGERTEAYRPFAGNMICIL